MCGRAAKVTETKLKNTKMKLARCKCHLHLLQLEDWFDNDPGIPILQKEISTLEAEIKFLSNYEHNAAWKGQKWKNY